MVHRRNIRDVQQAGEPSVAALCVREQGFSACLLQAVVNFSQLTESDARRGGSTQRPTPRGLDCGYRVPHLAR